MTECSIHFQAAVTEELWILAGCVLQRAEGEILKPDPATLSSATELYPGARQGSQPLTVKRTGQFCLPFEANAGRELATFLTSALIHGNMQGCLQLESLGPDGFWRWAQKTICRENDLIAQES